MRVRIALAEKGLPYDEKEIDLAHKPPELAQLNPAGAVPVLVVGSAAIPESLVIIQYLDDRYPDRPLLPRDPLQRARARLLADRITTLLGTHSYRLAKGTEEEKRGAAEAAKAALASLERDAPEEGLLAGPDLSIADVALAPFVARLPPELRPASLLLPRLARWDKAVMARPSVARHTAPRRPA
jgi:RNA polymerase-associated protein